MMSRQQDFISEVRTAAKKFWDAKAELKSLQPEAVALNYVDTLEDGVGTNEGITRAEVIAVLFTSTDALDAVFVSGGHNTNFAKLL